MKDKPCPVTQRRLSQEGNKSERNEKTQAHEDGQAGGPAWSALPISRR